MAIEKFINQGEEGVAIDGATVQITGGVVLEAPKAAAFLTEIPPDHQVSAIEEMLEHGAATMAAVRASAHVVLLERRIGELTGNLAAGLEEQLKEAGADQGKVTRKLLDEHREDLKKLLNPLTDPNVKDGLPTKMVEMLEHSLRLAEKQLEAMFRDADEGVLAKVVKSVVDQVKASEATLLQQFAAREALLTKSNLRGGRFEDVLSNRLPVLVRGIGRIEHCASVIGDKGVNAGDYVVTIDAGARAEVKVVVEAKSMKTRMSPNEIRQQLRSGRENRGAAAGILVSDSAASLPDGFGFGQVSECDFYVAYDPTTGDEMGISAALYLARAAAVASLPMGATETVDLSAVQHEADVVRSLMREFDTLSSCHSKAEKAIGGARKVADELRDDISAALRRLDEKLKG